MSPPPPVVARSAPLSMGAPPPSSGPSISLSSHACTPNILQQKKKRGRERKRGTVSLRTHNAHARTQSLPAVGDLNVPHVRPFSSTRRLPPVVPRKEKNNNNHNKSAGPPGKRRGGAVPAVVVVVAAIWFCSSGARGELSASPFLL